MFLYLAKLQNATTRGMQGTGLGMTCLICKPKCFLIGLSVHNQHMERGKMPRTNKQLRARPGYAHLTQWLADPARLEAEDPIWAPRDPGRHCIIFQHSHLRNASPPVRLGKRIAAYHHTTTHRHHFATPFFALVARATHLFFGQQPSILEPNVAHLIASAYSPSGRGC